MKFHCTCRCGHPRAAALVFISIYAVRRRTVCPGLENDGFIEEFVRVFFIWNHAVFGVMSLLELHVNVNVSEGNEYNKR